MIGQKGMPAIHGGVERHVHDLSVRLVQAGHTVDAYARTWYTGGATVDINGVHVIHTKGINTKHLDAITHTFTATIAAMKSNTNIIHYHGIGPALLSWMPRMFTPKKKVVVTFHSIDHRQVKWNWFAKQCLKIGEWMTCHMAHKVIAVSKTIKTYVQDVYGADIDYIPNAVQLPEHVTTTAALDTFGLRTDEYIIALARLIPDKGMHYLISAFLQLEEEQPEVLDGKKLVIVGGSYQTDNYVQYLHAMARSSRNIVFTGYQSGIALAELMSHAHMFVHPSTVEGLPITVLEAMSYGLPTLVSDIPEHTTVIPNNEYHFKNMDVTDLVTKIQTFLTESNLRNVAAATHLHTINTSYTWDVILPQILDAYESIIDAPATNFQTAPYTAT